MKISMVDKAIRFLIVGTLTVGLDWICYFFLVNFGFASIPISKGIAFITGAMFALAVNRLWTFQSKNKIQGDVVRFASIYSLALLLNISMNSLLLDKLKFVENIFIVAFLFRRFCRQHLTFLV